MSGILGTLSWLSAMSFLLFKCNSNTSLVPLPLPWFPSLSSLIYTLAVNFFLLFYTAWPYKCFEQSFGVRLPCLLSVISCGLWLAVAEFSSWGPRVEAAWRPAWFDLHSILRNFSQYLIFRRFYLLKLRFYKEKIWLFWSLVLLHWCPIEQEYPWTWEER